MKGTLLILGAGGGLGRTLLTCLLDAPGAYGRVFAIDRDLATIQKRFPMLPARWSFHEQDIGKGKEKELIDFIRTHSIETVVDLTDADTPSIAEAIFRDGTASYVNTAFCVDKPGPQLQRMREWLDELPLRVRKPHILFSGMNPGVVNVLAAHGARVFGKPKSIVEFEYDSSAWIKHPEQHVITWSRAQFLLEMVYEPAEEVVRKKKIKREFPNSLYHCEEMRELLKPVVGSEAHRYGCTTAHEECLTLADRFGVPVKFIYSVHPRTMEYLRRASDAKKKELNVIVADNVRQKLSGADTVGISLQYEDERVIFANRMANADVTGTSATMYQVMVGVLAALSTLRNDALAPKIYCTEDLLDTSFFSCVTKHLDIRQISNNKNIRVHSSLSSRDCISPSILLKPAARKRIIG
jgi:saccharopine dehydrogenase-like NADP-dependent oxidoreductase